MSSHSASSKQDSDTGDAGSGGAQAAEAIDLAAVARRILPLIDLTSLNDPEAGDDVVGLCDKAVTPLGPVAAVCVWPVYAAIARSNLRGTGVKVAVVVNFPGGSFPSDRVVGQIEEARADEVDEIDVVMPYHEFIQGSPAKALNHLLACREACGPVTMKVILETGSIARPALIEKAAKIAVDGGADFLKTSTGKVPVGATLSAARLLLEACRSAREAGGRPVGFKASGGVRDVLQAAEYLSLADQILGPDWADARRFRFGASGLLDAVLKQLGFNYKAPGGDRY
jgi:deoxyribose-phosphate aldolase